jgi:hypothetical protein
MRPFAVDAGASQLMSGGFIIPIGNGYWSNPTWAFVGPTPDVAKRDFLLRLHKLQWGDSNSKSNSNSSTSTTTVNCSNLITTVPISSGYGASLGFLYSTFWFAYTRGYPFQVVKRGPWMYALATSYDNYTWADCPDRDASCVYLPVSPCSRFHPATQPKPKRRPNPDDPIQVLEGLWLRDYLIRPNQGFRHAIATLKQPYIQQLQQEGCIALHVRRSDAGVPQRPFRRYAAIQEYLDLLPNTALNTTTTIFLLTDDASAIDELQQHFLNNLNSPFKWVYTNKTRNRGTEKGFDGHIPVDSHGPQELLWITVEHELAAAYCKTLVHGMSGYANILWDKMMLVAGTHGRKGLTKYYLDTKVEKDQVAEYQGKPNFGNREAHLMGKVHAFYANQTTL